MKTFSGILVVALFCAVAVYAKPSASSEIDEINKSITNMFQLYQCARSTVEELVKAENAKYLENELNKFKTETESALAKKCLDLKGKAKLMCAIEVSSVFLKSYESFLHKVESTHKSLATKMEEAVKSKCQM